MKKKNIIIIFDKFLYFFMKVVSKLCKNNLLTIFLKTLVGSQIVAHTLTEIGNGPNRPNTINL